MSNPAVFQTLSEVDGKPRRRAMSTEKSKAHHLCGQLKLRLQYAKLKVEHGWQRQNLNEVENLYFRHTHQRKPLDSSPAAQKRSAANRARAAAALARNESRQKEREREQQQSHILADIGSTGHEDHHLVPGLWTTPTRSSINSVISPSGPSSPQSHPSLYTPSTPSSFLSLSTSSLPGPPTPVSSPSIEAPAAIAALLATSACEASSLKGMGSGSSNQALTYDSFWSTHASKFPAVAASTAAFNLNFNLSNRLAASAAATAGTISVQAVGSLGMGPTLNGTKNSDSSGEVSAR